MSACDNAHHLMPLEEALTRMLASAQPLTETETLPLTQALGRVLAESCISGIDVPPRDNSAVDGYAICVTDRPPVPPFTLPISQRITAGAVPTALEPGTAERIFTGAFVPENANVVVMQEDCEAADGQVTLMACGPLRDNIRPQGQDIRSGQSLLSVGRKLLPQDLGLLASVGISRVTVFRRLKVAIFSTGDELAEPGTVAQAGQIYNSNRYTLTGMLQAMNAEIIDLGCIEDTAAATRAALGDAAARADVVITTGGVSVGEEDHVKAAIAALGKLDLWRLAIKPGKPLAFGHIGDCAVIGLPGNPAAVFGTFCMVAKPWLLKRQGAETVFPTALKVPAGFDVRKAGKRRDFLRVRLASKDGATQLELHPNQSSGVLSSASWADGFAVIKEGTTVTAGDRVDYLPFSQLLG